MQIQELADGATIYAAFHTMRELRTHLSSPEELVMRVHQQQKDGYKLIGICVDGTWVALAGYRFGRNLAWGKFLYVDDLVTLESTRGKGYGTALMHHLYEQARQHGCEQFHLDSGVQRFAAHKLYHRTGLRISSHHFSTELK
ncbi:MAG: GNAT family N-acetyltransferase [Verrucomicrobiota bacterium]|nr:GNAT family N-acetyltransferase [Verrucomicrobiota bacterium]